MEDYDQEWAKYSANLLKSELKRAGVNYDDLIYKLVMELDIRESYAGLVNKINRGRFTMAFFLQCMKVIGVKEVRL